MKSKPLIFFVVFLTPLMLASSNPNPIELLFSDQNQWALVQLPLFLSYIETQSSGQTVEGFVYFIEDGGNYRPFFILAKNDRQGRRELKWVWIGATSSAEIKKMTESTDIDKYFRVTRGFQSDGDLLEYLKKWFRFSSANPRIYGKTSINNELKTLALVLKEKMIRLRSLTRENLSPAVNSISSYFNYLNDPNYELSQQPPAIQYQVYIGKLTAANDNAEHGKLASAYSLILEVESKIPHLLTFAYESGQDDWSGIQMEQAEGTMQAIAMLDAVPVVGTGLQLGTALGGGYAGYKTVFNKELKIHNLARDLVLDLVPGGPVGKVVAVGGKIQTAVAGIKRAERIGAYWKRTRSAFVASKMYMAVVRGGNVVVRTFPAVIQVAKRCAPGVANTAFKGSVIEGSGPLDYALKAGLSCVDPDVHGAAPEKVSAFFNRVSSVLRKVPA